MTPKEQQLKEAAEKYAENWKHQVSYEGLENIINDFVCGAKSDAALEYWQGWVSEKPLEGAAYLVPPQKSTSYQRLTEQFQLLADKVIKKDKELRLLEEREVLWSNKVAQLNELLATKEEAIKELVQGLEWIEEKTRFNCYTDVDVAEINQRAEQLIQKHKP